MWNEIVYPFPNFNGSTVEIWESIGNFIPHFTGHVITYQCWDLSYNYVSNRAPGKIVIWHAEYTTNWIKSYQIE